ncbi:MAG: hypothetical protein AB8B64_13930 [Granulosicoccus sp.]
MIKRRSAHLFFALLSAGLASAIAVQAFKIHQNNQLSTVLASVPDSLESLDTVDNTAPMHGHPSMQLSLASALAQGGNLEDAERILNTLIGDTSDTSDTQLNTGALFNLANAYLRQVLATGSETTSQTLPMVELAKQRYRDLLSNAPEHWQARYNLERALRLAPEGSDRIDDGRIEPIKSVDVIVPGFEKKDLP